MPEVSVVMSVYNGDEYLSEAIESILAQSFRKFEFIIINDGSTDNTFSILNEINDSRILVIHQENKGLAVSLNIGIKKASGKYIARMDSDDISYPQRILEQVKVLRNNPKVVAVGSNATVIDKEGNYVYSTKQPLSWKEIKKRLPETPFVHPTVMFRKSEVLEIGGYPNVPISQDLFLFSKLANSGKYINLKEPLLKYRLRPDSISRKTKKLKKAVEKALVDYNKTGKIEEGDYLTIKKEKNKINLNFKFYHYHSILAKKYLWNNTQQQKAREHLKAAFKYEKNVFEIFSLFIASYLPASLLKVGYNFLKR